MESGRFPSGSEPGTSLTSGCWMSALTVHGPADRADARKLDPTYNDWTNIATLPYRTNWTAFSKSRPVSLFVDARADSDHRLRRLGNPVDVIGVDSCQIL